MGREELQAGQVGFGLGTILGKVGSRYPVPLAARVLRLFVLLAGLLRRPLDAGSATGWGGRESTPLTPSPSRRRGGGKENPEGPSRLAAVVAGADKGEGVAGAVYDAAALLEGVLQQASAERVKSVA